jgi:hypothetical protein
VGNTRVTPVAAWRPGTHVAGVGTIGYGPMGSIVAPVSGEVCAYVYGKAGSLAGAVALRPGRRLTVFTTDEQGTVLARRESQAQSSRKLAVVLGVAGLIITGVATGVAFLVV